MSGRRSRGWESERANLHRNRCSSPRTSRRSRSTSRTRRRSPRRFRRSPSIERNRRPPSSQEARGHHHGQRSAEVERFSGSRSREIYEPESIYEPPPPLMSQPVQRFSPPPSPAAPLTTIDLSFESSAVDNEDVANEKSFSSYETIPEFDPDNSQLTARDWIRVVDAVAHKKKWTKEEKKYHMSQKLVGVGRQWYLATTKVEYTWSALKQQFISAFPSDMDYYTLLQNMFERKKKVEESYASYFTQKVGLLENCGITGAKAVSCIIGGLPTSKIKESAFRQYFRTVDALYEFLRESEKQENSTKTVVQVEKKEKNAKSFGFSPRDNNVRKNNKKTITSPPAGKVMFGALGKVQTLDKYFVDVQINGTLFRGYIDFKSSVCTIREETAKFAGLDYQRCYESVIGFNGYSVSTVGQVKAAIAIDQGLAIVDVYICPDHIQAIPVVVGQNFLRRADILVMQDNKSISIYQQGDNASFPTREMDSYPYAMQGNYDSSFVQILHHFR